jgi:cobalt-zinc-cadmium efflux system membrane fusion protein
VSIVLACGDPPAVPEHDHEHAGEAENADEGAAGHDHEGDHDDRDHALPRSLVLTPEGWEAAGIELAPAGVRAQVPTVRVTGTLSYDESRMAIATARVGGRIARVAADYGQTVRAGEPLAWIDSPELAEAQAGWRRARSMEQLARAEHERARLLVEGDAIARGEALRREADWQAARAELDTAERRLRILGLPAADVAALGGDAPDPDPFYPVRAPTSGSVTERHAVPGRVVAPEDELFTVARLDRLWLFLHVFEKDLPSVTEGATVLLTCESHPEDRFRGTIDFVGQVIDPHSRTARARAVIENPDGELKPGMFVYATIEGRSEAGAGTRLAVPAAAVATIDGRSVVFVHSGERAFEVRAVDGATSGEWFEVASGLTEGETIAVSGAFVLKSEVLESELAEHHH